jgi:hypothetical protein
MTWLYELVSKLKQRLNKQSIVYYVPCEESELDGSWFQYPTGPVANYYNMPLMRYCLEQAGFQFKVTDGSKYESEAARVKKVIVFDTPHYNDGRFLKAIPKEKKVIFIWEPPSVGAALYAPELHAEFDRVFTWQDDLVDRQKYFKFYYPYHGSLKSVRKPFEERALCTMINRNKHSSHSDELYTERKNAIKFFQSLGTNEFTLYGSGWDQPEYPSLAGAPTDKLEVLNNYQFLLCYESMHNIQGYVSEKIIDAFLAGCIPIYWGASNIEKFVPSNCFVDKRKFDSYPALYNYLKNISRAEVQCYHDSIETFMKSPACKLFSAQHFVEIVMKDALNHPMSSTLKKAVWHNL